MKTHPVSHRLGPTSRAASPSQTARRPAGKAPRPGRVRGAAPFVWGVWALMLLGALAFDWWHASPIPFGDELVGLPRVAGRPVTLAWLWEAHNGQHRLPLPKLVLLGLHAATDYNFFAVAFFNPVAMAVMAAGMIGVARRLRGRTSYLDVFFPVILLHWGHGDNLLTSWEVVFVVPVLVTVVLLILLTRLHARWAFATLLAAGVAVALHPLCGGPGVPYAAAFVPWLGYAAFLTWRRLGSYAKLKGSVLLTLAVVVGLTTYLYFDGIRANATVEGIQWQSPDHATTCNATVQFLSMGFGPCGPRSTITYYGRVTVFPVWAVLGTGVLALMVLSAGRLAAAWWQYPGERLRTAALLCFLAGAGGLALGTGYSRGGAAPNFIVSQTRYCLLAVPLFCCLFLAWQVYGRGRWRRAVHGALVLLAVLLLPLNMTQAPDEPGVGDNSIDYLRGLREFERELRVGAPATQLLTNYGAVLSFGLDRPTLLRLHQDKVGVFRNLRTDPPFREEPLAPEQVFADTGITWPQPRFIYGVRLEYTFTGPDVRLRTPAKLFWRKGDQRYWTGARANDKTFYRRFSGQNQQLLFWLEGDVQGLRLEWADGARFAVNPTVTLLVP